MTYAEVLACEKDMLTPEDIAPILGSHPHTITVTARENPESMRYLQPIFIGNRCKIPRLRFINWYEGKNDGMDC